MPGINLALFTQGAYRCQGQAWQSFGGKDNESGWEDRTHLSERQGPRKCLI